MKRTKTYIGSHYRITRATARTALKHGRTIRAAARLMGCSYGTAITVFEYYDIQTGDRGRRRVQLERELLASYVEGYSWRAIARELMSSVGTVRKEFKRHGLRKRDERSKNDWIACEVD